MGGTLRGFVDGRNAPQISTAAMPPGCPFVLPSYAYERVTNELLLAMKLSTKQSGEGLRWGIDPEAPGWGQCEGVAGTSARLSPLHAILLRSEDKKALHIPEEASHIAYSYPLELQKRTRGIDEDPDVHFLKTGGFIYTDGDSSEARIVSACVLQQRPDGEVQFRRGSRWEPKWTKSFADRDRFQKVTVQHLSDAGAQYYGWLNPSEEVDGNAICPEAGGFVFLFGRYGEAPPDLEDLPDRPPDDLPGMYFPRTGKWP